MVLDEVVVDRFWEGVDIQGENDCWEWKRSCADGYGRFWVNLRMEGAHRVSWTIARGVIPELFEELPACVCHKCDNRKCCNPNHLFLGNSKVNQKDSAVKGRHAYPQPWQRGSHLWHRGERHPQALKIETEIKEIKADLKEGILTQEQIGRKHGLSRSAVSAINVGRRWPHVK